ncbi:hypothetical protein SKAU_G00313860 [Synaphobranchus kaupii]|uniref:non-specific serine/threonine protein kinase n=1 Tax=Synaphobranchus kaupii TaxID=118154 RepID=A0A9Q1ESB2_SYNKA|nr:hypothetical protein SKAU_G00313860 [Synaphobranchus kaupii]
MSSRRPLLRSFSGSGRYGNFDGDVIATQSSRAEGRSYQLSMRTETRNTLCSVMAQLAVETQPSFETTLKSKAVSESCNVKFTCVVSGNPTPEVTWYKDDMEMDRYCGLPKYEIFSSDKTNTLQIYNCTQDDAAIYQASARNSKGIVSCSGLLEVGAMNEFKIHQRFFAKLKQKADSKRKDLEQSRHRGGETMRGAIAERPRAASPVRKPRFVRSPSEPGPTPPLPSKQETKPPALEDEPAEQPVERPVEQPVDQLVERPAVTAKTPITNGFAAHQDPVKENGKPTFLYFGNKVEIITKRPATKDTLANKVVKIGGEPAGGSAGDSGSALSSSGKQKEAGEGEMSLARYLTEYSSSEPSVPQRNGAPPGEASKPGPVAGRQVAKERETAKHKGAPGRGPPRVSVPAERVSAETVVQKGPESPGTLASMFFSLRDMFFRSRNKTEDPPAAVSNGIDPPHVCSARAEGRRALPTVPLLPRPEPPQTRQREDSCIAGPIQTPAPQSEHVELATAMPSVDAHVKAKTQPPEPLDDLALERRSGLEGPSPGVNVRSVASLPSGEGAGGLTAPPLCLHEPVHIQLPASDWSRSPETVPTPQPPPETEVSTLWFEP